MRVAKRSTRRSPGPPTQPSTTRQPSSGRTKSIATVAARRSRSTTRSAPAPVHQLGGGGRGAGGGDGGDGGDGGGLGGGGGRGGGRGGRGGGGDGGGGSRQSQPEQSQPQPRASRSGSPARG